MLIAMLLMMQAAPGPNGAPFDYRRDQQPLIRAHCRKEWPDNFVMQEHCQKAAIGGMGDFVAAARRHGPKIERALEKCVEDWTAAGVPNWMMIGHCSKSQADALERLNRQNSTP